MKQGLAVAGLVAGLAGGAAAGLALGVPSLAGAQNTTTTTTPPTTAPSGTSGTAPTPTDRSQWMKDTLAPLVSNGTITQAQADAVIAALEAAKPDRPAHGHGHRLMVGLSTAATALGVTEAELRTALESGKSIADVAEEKGVDVQKVIDDMVAAAKTHLAEEVTAGRLTQAEADQKLTEATTRITAIVNGEAPLRGPRGERRAPGSPAPSTTPTTAAS